MRIVKNTMLVVFLVLMIIIMVQNAQTITFRFLNWSYQASQLLLVVIVLAVGFLAGFITAKMPGGPRDE